MESVIVEARSGNLRKALAINSQAREFSRDFNIRTIDPNLGTVGAFEPTILGTFASGSGQSAAASIFIMPYCEGPVGSKFRMRIYGWRASEGDPSKVCSFPYPLVELACIAGSKNGPQPNNVNSPRDVLPTERMCDTIIVAKGMAMVNSWGPGSGTIACATIPLGGCRLYGFDFETFDQNVSMNCWHARS